MTYEEACEKVIEAAYKSDTFNTSIYAETILVEATALEKKGFDPHQFGLLEEVMIALSQQDISEPELIKLFRRHCDKHLEVCKIRRRGLITNSDEAQKLIAEIDLQLSDPLLTASFPRLNNDKERIYGLFEQWQQELAKVESLIDSYNQKLTKWPNVEGA